MNIEYYEELSREEMVEEMLQADQYHQTLLNEGALLKSEIRRITAENESLRTALKDCIDYRYVYSEYAADIYSAAEHILSKDVTIVKGNLWIF